ncbi:MAG: AsmA family protein, partial [Thermoanaerobaculia bacterium]
MSKKRFRRWVLRPAIWLAVILMVLTVVAFLLPNSEWARARMVAAAQEAAARLLGREVQVGSITFSWFYPTLQISDVLIAGPTAQSPAVASVHEISIDISLEALLRRKVLLNRVEVIAPSVFVEVAESGRDNLPRLSRSEGSNWLTNGSWSIEVGVVKVDQGVVIINQRQIPIDLRAHNFRARIVSDSRGAVDVGIDVHDVEILLPNATPYLGTVGIRGRLAGSDFELLGARVSGPFLRSAMSGQASWSDGLRIHVASQTEIDADLLQSLGLTDTRVEGSFSLKGDFSFKDDQWSYIGEFNSKSTTIADRRFRDLSGRLAVDATRFHLDLEKVRYGAGSVSGEVRVNLQTEPFQVDLDFVLTEVELHRLIADQGLALQGVFGEVSGPVEYGFSWSDFLRGSGRADLQITSRVAERIDVIKDLPGIFLTGSAPFVIEKGVLQASSVTLDAPSQSLVAAGFYDLGSHTGSLDYQVKSTDLVQLLRVLPSSVEAEKATPWMPEGGEGVFAGTVRLSASGAEIRVEMSLPSFKAPGINADLL